jgi:hypothetical protein
MHARGLTPSGHRPLPRSGGSHPPAGRTGRAVTDLQRSLGNRALSRLLQTGAARAKLRVSHAGDPYEREADRIADHVMRMPDQHVQRKCASCAAADGETHEASEPAVEEGIGSGLPLDRSTRAYFEPRFGADFGGVRVHTDTRAATSARSMNALAYTIGTNIVFAPAQYAPATHTGRRLLAHELAHVVQQADATRAAPTVRRRAAPYIKKVTVHLTPPQSADLEWEGTPPSGATGSDHFTVSTGKGYGDPGDPPGTCTRDCCGDPDTQCAPPWNRPDRVGACCTFYGDSFWTGTPRDEHNGWKWWTPIQPYYSQRGIALHQHTEVTGQPIGHGCVRMDEPNAKRIYDFSNGRRTNVTTDGRAAPVACDASRRCGASAGGAGASLGTGDTERLATTAPVNGLEGLMT